MIFQLILNFFLHKVHFTINMNEKLKIQQQWILIMWNKKLHQIQTNMYRKQSQN